ncbi:YbjN domain-containing protein [Nocardioides bruguierae]|uniref:YbjN domain-containing protein n=1 Tax=Nocardioides bruguierae TaxID=2945102 RepID=A0A9X2D9F5_9ACTN|nr:YbjN domain-containing protein [Nocardioides bruguierae]MCM0621793.1 YbjN domain-containing protein [Nocardioides bruguierae]
MSGAEHDALLGGALPPERVAVAAVVRDHLASLELEVDESSPGVFSFALPGEKKLSTAVRLDVGTHALGVHAFVCRAPDENHAGVYRWLLERNLRMYGVAFALDRLGDIYLDGRLPLSAAQPDDLDRVLGSVLTYADDSFNTILELGFASSIRKEWEWRRLRGESTANLEAFRGWLEAEEPDPGD